MSAKELGWELIIVAVVGAFATVPWPALGPALETFLRIFWVFLTMLGLVLSGGACSRA